jgi:DHA2 family multidrug resistance protein
VPLSAVTLATLPPERRTDGTALFNLSRNIGSSVGISVVTSQLTRNTQVNRVLESPAIARPRRTRRHDTQQAEIIAFIDDFKTVMIATLLMIPLLIVFKQAAGGRAQDYAHI